MAKSKTTIETTKLGNKIRKGKGGKPVEGAGKKEESVLNAGEEPVGHKETIRFFFGLLLLVLALFMLLSFTSYLFTGADDQCLVEQGVMDGFMNYTGAVGAYCADFGVNHCFGFSAFIVPVFLIVAAMKLMRAYKVRLWKWFFHCVVLVVWISVAASFFLQGIFESLSGWNFMNPGGDHGLFVSHWLNQRIGAIGTFMLLLVVAVAYLAYVSGETIRLVRRILNPVDYIKSKLPAKGQHESSVPGDFPVPAPASSEAVGKEESGTEVDVDGEDAPRTVELEIPERPAPEGERGNGASAPGLADPAAAVPELDIVKTVKEEVADKDGVGALEPYDPKLDLENYHYPTLELLDKREDDHIPIDMTEQNQKKDRIIEVLRNFGVEIVSIKATVGPTVTLYEITQAQGVRISRIRNLEDDIAQSLSAKGIRIIAPIPGKGTIGIEVPNDKPRIVSMESILNSRKFRETSFELPIALGKTITNEVFMVDLAKMPHLLVAGATGQGKSVGLNAIITSLLYKKHPAELKFVMVDPKKVEFSIYSPIENHFLAKIADDEGEPIITDVQKVVATLKSLCAEMDMRYDLLKKARVRNIKEYNEKFKNRQLNPENGHRFMPYIVVIIDEFGDLIMTAGKEVELPIARIAQLARAVGIHMVIATQRPTTNIITGTIKANFPARMAFKVSQMIDSRTILDQPGANRLIGRGDMLFLSGSEPVRVQCAFVDTPEVERITNYIATQQSYLGPFELPRVEAEGDGMMGGDASDLGSWDPLCGQAAQLIVATQQGSTSMIQRKFAIGYNRAGRIMDQLERAGVVGAAQGSKPREVLYADESALQMRLDQLGIK